MNGKVRLPIIQVHQLEIFAYMIGSAENSGDFLQNIHRYSSCFQITSFGVASICNVENFTQFFLMQRQIYHRLGLLMCAQNEMPKFLQIYFV